jgi:PAP_fibrillin
VKIASELEVLNTIKEPLKSDLLNGKWELIYTTSESILQTQVTNWGLFLLFLFWIYEIQHYSVVIILKDIITVVIMLQRPKFLRPNGKIYQAINADTLRAQNMETWPYFNQVSSNPS